MKLFTGVARCRRTAAALGRHMCVRVCLGDGGWYTVQCIEKQLDPRRSPNSWQSAVKQLQSIDGGVAAMVHMVAKHGGDEEMLG